jgi:hypothetical protein
MLEGINTPGICLYADIGDMEDSADVISDLRFTISDFLLIVIDEIHQSQKSTVLTKND